MRSANRLGDAFTRAEVLTYAGRSALRSGALPIGDGWRLANDAGFIAPVDLASYAVTDLGRNLLGLGDEDEPNAAIRRAIVSRLILSDPPTWVAYWQGDPSALDFVLPVEEAKSLEGAGLFPQDESDQLDLSRWAFWKALGRVPLVSETAVQRKRLGDAGEVLTVEFERERLLLEGHPELADLVRWIAQESDAYGFDVLSYKGGSGDDANSEIAIEVKATSLPRGDSLHFFLTSHEWETASSLGDRYRIYVWTSVDPGPPATTRDSGPLEISMPSIAEHLPSNSQCGGGCRWQSAELSIPIDLASDVGR